MPRGRDFRWPFNVITLRHSVSGGRWVGRARRGGWIGRHSVAKNLLSCLLLWLPLALSASVRPLIVVGSSMDPALMSGQLVLLHQDYYRTHSLEPGDVVAFRWKGAIYVKRVFALGGARVKLAQNGDYSY